MFSNPNKIHPLLISMMEQFKNHYRRPFTITSDWRDDPESSHYLGKAVDIRAHSGETRHRIVEAAIKAGFRRIGVYDRHVHLDVDHTRPYPTIWTGKSK